MATVALNDGQMESYVELTKNYETTVRLAFKDFNVKFNYYFDDY